MSGFENFIGLNPWTALFTLCNLAITYLILKKFLFKPVNKMIDDRQKEIDDLYGAAETAKSEAEAMKEDYDRRLSEAKQTSAELIQAATQDANRRSDEIILQARGEANAIREKARRDIDLEKKKAMNDVKGDISKIAVDIAEKVVARELNRKEQERLIEGFLQEMGDQP